jgi:hypothetical protein
MNQTPTTDPEFGDNTLVQRHRWGNEYLAISLRPADERRQFRVYVYRYTVPGRCDTYSFQWRVRQSLEPNSLRYFSDGWLPLAKALKLVEEDFNRESVVEMCEDAFRAEQIVLHYRRDFLELLEVIAPKSKTYRAVKRLCERTMEERKKKFEAKKALEKLRKVPIKLS